MTIYYILMCNGVRMFVSGELNELPLFFKKKDIIR